MGKRKQTFSVDEVDAVQNHPEVGPDTLTDEFGNLPGEGSVAVAEPPKQVKPNMAPGAPSNRPAVVTSSTKPRRADRVTDGIHVSGLPIELVTDRAGKKKVVDYVNQYGYGPKDRKEMEVTPQERHLYEEYRKDALKYGAAPREYYIAALRMFTAGMPLMKADVADLNTMRIETLNDMQQRAVNETQSKIKK